jgi:hypothetical protein
MVTVIELIHNTALLHTVHSTITYSTCAYYTHNHIIAYLIKESTPLLNSACSSSAAIRVWCNDVDNSVKLFS